MTAARRERRLRPVAARGLIVAGVCAVAGGCTPEPIPLDLTDRDVDFGFLVVVDSNLSPRRLSATFAIEDQEVVHGALPAVSLLDADEGAVFVAFRRTDVADRVHGFDTSAPSSIAVRIGQPPSSATVVYRRDAWTTTLKLPEDSAVINAETGATLSDRRTLDSLYLTVTVDPEFCGKAYTNKTVPFGATERILPNESLRLAGHSGSKTRNIEQLLTLDDDTIIGLHRAYLFMATRGEDVPSTPLAETWPAKVVATHQLTPSSPRGALLFRAALSPTTRADGRRTLLLAGKDHDEQGLILEVAVDGRGFEPIGTASIALAQVPALEDVIFDVNGNALATGDEGVVLVRRPGERVFTPAPVLTTLRLVRRIVSTGDPEAPHLLASDDGRLHVGDAISGALMVTPISHNTTSLHFNGLAVAGGELWAAAEEGVITVRGTDGGWKPAELITPPSMDLCSIPIDGGARILAGEVLDLATDGDHVYAIFAECSAIVRIRLSDRCVSPILRGDEPVNVSTVRNRDLHIRGDELFIGGDEGMVYVLDVR